MRGSIALLAGTAAQYIARLSAALALAHAFAPAAVEADAR